MLTAGVSTGNKKDADLNMRAIILITCECGLYYTML